MHSIEALFTTIYMVAATIIIIAVAFWPLTLLLIILWATRER